MSPAVGNFVHDLVEMAKAMEELPIIEAEARNLQVRLDAAQHHSQQLELNIVTYKEEIEALHARVRSLEVERDDASFRVLEMEDKTHQVVAMLRNALSETDKAMTILDPPKPQPQPVAEPVQPQKEQVRGPEELQAEATQAYGLVPPPQGQSEADSTTMPVHADIPQPIASPIAQDASTADPEPTPKWSYEWYSWNDRRNERERVKIAQTY